MQTNERHIGAVVSTSGRIEIKSVPTKRPGAGEILVSPLMVGICGTDLEIIRRTRPDTATILGHEGVAEIVEVGAGVADFSVGQKVVFNPVNPHDQNEILGHSMEGLLQQRLLVSQSALEWGMVVPFDINIPLICSPLVEPLGTVIYGRSLVDQVCNQESIVVVGAGPIGLLNAVYARYRGCSRIFLVDSSVDRLNWAVRRHIVHSDEIILNSPDIADIILQKTASQGVDAVYLCTTRSSAREALRLSLRYLRVGGCVDLVVGFSDGDSIPELPELELNGVRRANRCGIPQFGSVIRCHTTEQKEVWLTGHRGTSEYHIRAAMQLLHEDSARFSNIISHTVSLQSIPLVFKQLLTSTVIQLKGATYIKAVIDFARDGQIIEFFSPYNSL
jgi:2-epi-valiolone-7-phosphate 1-reductase